MQSCALMNGQHQQIRQASQPSQAAPYHAHDATRNLQSWTPTQTIHYQARNLGVQNVHSEHFPLHNGAYSNRQMSNLQTSAGTYQEVSSQQTGGGNNNSYFSDMLFNYIQNVSANKQSGNPSLPASGFQIPTLQDCDQNSSTQSPPNQMNSNATYTQQGMSTHWKESVVVNERQMIGTRDRTVTDIQHVSVQQGMQQNVNGDLTKPISAYTTPTISFPAERGLCTSTMMSGSEQTVYLVPNNQVQRQSGTQHGFSPVISQSYNMGTSQTSGNNNTATYPPSSAQNSYFSTTSHKTQQYSAQHQLRHNNGIKTATYNNSNFYKKYDNITHSAKMRARQIKTSTQQKVIRHSLSADSLNNSCTPGSDGCPAPPPYSYSNHRRQQFVRTTTMIVSNQSNIQPGTSATPKNYSNLNAIKLLPGHSGQSLPQSTQSVMSRTQHAVSRPHQQTCVPNSFHKSAAGNEKSPSKENNEIHPKKNCSLIELLLGSSLLPESADSKTRSSVASSFETLPSVQLNDSSVHSSPGNAGTKAVAVVQPLPSLESQLHNDHASCDSTAGDSLNNPKKTFALDTTAINKTLPTTESGTQNTGKQSELDVNVQNSIPSQESVSQNSPEDQSGIQTLSTSPVSDLSALPTAPWTLLALTKLIKDAEKNQKEPSDLKELHTAQKILDLFWEGKLETLQMYSSKVGFLRVLGVKDFCKKYLTANSVVLLEVDGNFEEQMKSYHVLKDNEVFSELPYKSSWLNLNEQLDEIDKEFGFPLSLKHHTLLLESDGQKDQMHINNSDPAIVSKVPSKVLPLTDFEPVDSNEGKETTTLEPPSIQTSSPNQTDGSSDPCLSLKIQVMPPEEARRYHEQMENAMPQSMDAERVVGSFTESETPDNTESTSRKSELETVEIGISQSLCCLTKLLEMTIGSSTPSDCKCHTQKEQKYRKWINKTSDIGETVVLKHNNQFGKDPVKDKENTDDQVVTFSGPEFCSLLDQAIDLTEDDDQPHSPSELNSKNHCKIANTSHSSVIFINDEDEDLSSGENEILSQKTDLAIKLSERDDKCGQEQPKSTPLSLSGASVSTDKAETDKFCSTEIAIQLLDHGRSCEEALDVPASPLKTKEQSQICANSDFKASVKHKKTKRKHKRLEWDNEFGPPQKESKKCNSPVDLNLEHALDGVSKCEKEPDVEAEALNIDSKRTAELVLFGSAQRDKCALTGRRKAHSPFVKNASKAAHPRPPEVLTVNLNPLSSKFSDTVYNRNYSVKQLIHDKWWRSFQPTKASHKKKLKRRSYSVAGGSLMKRDETKDSRNLKMLGEEKKDIIADNKRRSSKNESQNVKPCQEHIVLRFSVLPSNFDLKDGSSGRKESTDPVSEERTVFTDKPEKEQSAATAVTKPKGKWGSSLQKNRPQHIPKTFSLFHEYQKKYKERAHSKDE
ncbi:protein AMN1 homolog [Oreochromis niloticus]|uniref:protein AMN1 homolog n=1 Tax=Oreochromis niloticus TaxID=8128 RepID=UPI0003944348|nr:uncharacterized protein LOC100704526 [Oreochromis niloticus]